MITDKLTDEDWESEIAENIPIALDALSLSLVLVGLITLFLTRFALSLSLILLLTFVLALTIALIFLATSEKPSIFVLYFQVPRRLLALPKTDKE